MSARRRLLRDFKKLQEDPPLGCSGAPLENNLLSWNCIIFGPQGTPFEDGTFRLGMDFSEDYPNKPPKVRFVSKMFHPNVYADGSICLDILNSRWSPSYDVASILTSIQSLLDMPNPNSPANSLAAQLYQTDRREYDRRVVAIVEQSWLDVDGGSDGEGEFCKTKPPPPSSSNSAAVAAVAAGGGGGNDVLQDDDAVLAAGVAAANINDTDAAAADRLIILADDTNNNAAVDVASSSSNANNAARSSPVASSSSTFSAATRQ